MNLLSNAIKFSQRGGVILARLKVLAGYEDTDKIEIAVTDYGVGIAPSEISKVFSPGVKAKKGSKQEETTKGTSLYVCKVMAQCLDGTISV